MTLRERDGRADVCLAFSCSLIQFIPFHFTLLTPTFRFLIPFALNDVHLQQGDDVAGHLETILDLLLTLVVLFGFQELDSGLSFGGVDRLGMVGKGAGLRLEKRPVERPSRRRLLSRE